MGLLRSLDREILFLLNHLGPEGAAREAVIRLVATGALYALLAVAVYLGLRRRSGRAVLICALGGAVLAFVVGKTINQIVPRDRPFVVFPDELRHVALIVRPDSFPSIHAAGGFGLAGGVLFAGYWRWGIAMLLLAVAMAAARVAAGVHWPSDVAAGALIGCIMAAIAAFAQRHHWPRSARRPEEGAGGGATESDQQGARS